MDDPRQGILTFKEEILSTGKVRIKEGTHVPSCPYCDRQDLIIHGRATYPYQEIIVDGQVTGHTKIDPDAMDLEIEAFDCRRCLIKFIVRPDDEIEMYETIQQLTSMIGNKKPC